MIRQIQKQGAVISLLFFLFTTGQVNGQRFGNEWIVPSQAYYKFGVKETGIYRITYNDLKNAGMLPDAINPKKIQLFHHGKEMAVLFEGQDDGRFDINDYMELYAEKNTGELDSLVYKYARRPHPYQTLFSDETFYFITLGQNDGKRIRTIASTSENVTDKYHMEEQVTAFNSQYSFNNSTSFIPLVQQSYFETGEGWSGKYMTADSVAGFPFNMSNRVEAPGIKPIFEFQLNGRTRNPHKVWYALNNGKALDTLAINEYDPLKVTVELNPEQIVNESILLRTRLINPNIFDWYSMNYLKMTYPQSFLMSGKTRKYFYLNANPAGRSVIQINDLSPAYFVYDITDLNNQQRSAHVGGKFAVENTALKKKIFVSNDVKKPAAIKPVTFLQPDQNADYIIITHQSLLESAGEYAAYRASATGGGFKPLVIETREIYEQFNYGERNPMAIKKFADYMLVKGKDKYLLLAGRAVSFPDSMKTSEASDLVPTVGYPGSDALLTEGLAGNEAFVQAIPTGRLNVSTNQQVRNYLAKVKEFELAEPAEWNKRILHLSGGKVQTEISSLKTLMNDLSKIAEKPFFAGQVSSKSKQTEAEIEPVDISKEVNEGVSMITFAGHGSPTVIDLNFGFVSDPKSNIKNKGKYPLMFFNGCGVGNIFYRYQTLSTDWLLTPDKGSIAILANSFWSYVSSTQEYLKNLYEKSFEDAAGLNLSIGRIQQEIHRKMAAKVQSDPLLRLDLQQVVLQGDPVLKIFKLAKPDFAAIRTFISSQKPGIPMAASDSVKVGVVVSNYGKFEAGQKVSAQITAVLNNGQSQDHLFKINTVAFKDTVYFNLKREPGFKSLEINLDNDDKIDELNEKNNSSGLDLSDWNEISKNSSYPANILPDKLNPVLILMIDGKLIRNNDFVGANPLLKVTLSDDNDLPAGNTGSVEVLLKKCGACSFEKLEEISDIEELPGELIVTYPLKDLTPGTYDILARGHDLAGNTVKNPYLITFRVAENKEPLRWSVFPNPGQYFVKLNFDVVSQTPPESAIAVFYDSRGGLIDTIEIKPTVGENTIYWEKISVLPAGIYHVVLKITDGGKDQVIKAKILKQ